ncbi:tyrosine-type recombinase/integrase [Pseudonocardia parietis]|uniref:Integrase n=1 Tax=Pseudonocardia parietis TaxID=570936 RepID=A0ABS4VM83_9PSEU|nr:site-specific integrase [Pseudonocardia parietis]MBP2365039.1 integrase [Pseudonocardia parietis]
MASIKKRPDGTWRARYRGPDRRERARHFARKVDAERWVASVEVAKSRGEWIDPSLSRERTGTWCRKWLAAQEQLKPTTRVRYEGIISKHIEPTWGAVPLAEVAPADVAAWVGQLTSSGLSAASVRYCHRVLSLALGYAQLDGRLSRNPAEGIPLPRVKSKQKRYLTHAEVALLAQECGDYGVLVNVLAYTGLRWGEAAALRVSDLDLMRRRITVRRAMAEVRGRAELGTPKDHERRDVPVPMFLVDDMAAHVSGLGPDDLVFSGRGGGILRNGNFRRDTFDAAAKRAGVVGVTPHALRHTAASLAIAAGATVVLVQRMLGHASPSVTLDVYSHLFADDLDTVADRLHEAKINSGADQMRTSGQVILLTKEQGGDRDAV